MPSSTSVIGIGMRDYHQIAGDEGGRSVSVPRTLLSPSAAYILGPLVSLTFVWVVITIYDAQQPNWTVSQDLMLLPRIFLFGGAICLAAEVIVVTPILLAFRRYRWRWINGWSALLIGFLTGAAVFLLGLYLSRSTATWSGSVYRAVLFGFAGLVGTLPFVVRNARQLLIGIVLVGVAASGVVVLHLSHPINYHLYCYKFMGTIVCQEHPAECERFANLRSTKCWLTDRQRLS